MCGRATLIKPRVRSSLLQKWLVPNRDERTSASRRRRLVIALLSLSLRG